jgi:hypothetical protein
MLLHINHYALPMFLEAILFKNLTVPCITEYQATWSYKQEVRDVKECTHLHHGVLLNVSIVRSSKTVCGAAPVDECIA